MARRDGCCVEQQYHRALRGEGAVAVVQQLAVQQQPEAAAPMAAAHAVPEGIADDKEVDAGLTKPDSSAARQRVAADESEAANKAF